MSLTTLRRHLNEKVYYNSDYFGEEITYHILNGESKTFNAIPNLTETSSEFSHGNGRRLRSGTFMIPKSEVSRAKRDDRIAYDSSDFLVEGIDTENNLNCIVVVKECQQVSTGGVIKE